MSDYFRLRFRIEGVPELSRILGITHKKLSNFKEPLWRAARLILKDVETQFRTEGGLSGGWTPLAASTVAGRLREGFGGEHPILQRTGKLRRSFYAYVDSRKTVITSKPGVAPYYAFHQSRLPRTRLPRRPMLLLVDKTRQNIVEEFNKFLRFK